MEEESEKNRMINFPVNVREPALLITVVLSSVEKIYVTNIMILFLVYNIDINIY